jgi:hypothetical protein
MNRIVCRVCNNELHVDGSCKCTRIVRDQIPEWIAREIRETWRAALATNGFMESYGILERMVERLGYGRIDENPPKYKGHL